MTLVGMLGLASGTVVQKHWAGAADVRVAAAVQSVTGAALVLPAVAVFGGRFDVSLQLVLSLGWLAWGMGIVTLLLLVHLLRGHAASTVGALLLVVPAVTAIASAPASGRRSIRRACSGWWSRSAASARSSAARRRPPEPGTSGPARRDLRVAAGLQAPLAARASSAGAVRRGSARGWWPRTPSPAPGSPLDRRLRRHRRSR